MMARASGRRFFIAEITSSPLPSVSRMSTTAKAGAAFSTCRSPSATDSAVATTKPRPSIARARRCKNDLSSSTIRSERSLGIEAGVALVMAIYSVNASNRYSRAADLSGCLSGYAASRGVARQQIVNNQANLVTELSGRDRGLKRGRWGRDQRPLEIGAVPGHVDGGPVERRLLIRERKPGAGTFQEGFGDEEAETEPKNRIVVAFSRPARRRPAVGDGRLPETGQNLGSEAWAVVADGDTDLVGIPLGEDFDPGAREIDRVLDQVPETVADRGIARAQRLSCTVGREGDADRHAKIALRRHRLIKQHGQR